MILRKIIICALFIFPLYSFGNILDKAFIKEVLSPFQDVKLDTQKPVKLFTAFFKGKPYRVVMKLKIGYPDKIIYFAIEEYPRFPKGFKRGIFVNEDGIMQGFFDQELGVYTRKAGFVIDFVDIGIKKGDVECFVLGIQTSDIMQNEQNPDFNTGLDLYLIDKNLHNITLYREDTDVSVKNFFVMLRLAADKNNKYSFIYNYGWDFQSKKESLDNLKKDFLYNDAREALHLVGYTFCGQ